MTDSGPGEFGSHVFPGSQAIDLEAIDQLRLLEDEDEPDVVGELVRLFLRNTPPRLAAMDEALAAQDLVTLSKSAHSLKSSSAHLGAIGMRQVCEKLEAMKDPVHLDEATHLVALLHREFEVVSRALPRIAADRPSQF